MNQFNVGEKVWYNYEERERVFKIAEIKGNVAILESDNTSGDKTKVEAYLTELKPYAPCIVKNVIGRPSCDYKTKNK